MISRKNDGGGTTIIMVEGNLLADVPVSHEDIVTPEIRSSFENPVRFFELIAERTEISSFRRYLNAMTSGGRWSLVLADTYMPVRRTVGGFLWKHPSQYRALISPANSDLVTGPFSVLYNDVGIVHWNDIAWGGGLFHFADHILLDKHGIPSQDERFPETSTSVFGSSSCGDVMVYNSDSAIHGDTAPSDSAIHGDTAPSWR